MKAFVSFLILLGFVGSLYSANLVKYELNVNEFHELKVVDGINVVYSCNPDSAGKAVFTCQASQASAFIFNNKKGKLSMQVSTEKAICPQSMSILHILQRLRIPAIHW